MSLPTVSEVRSRIESVQREDIRNCLKAVYVLGAARIIEIVGELSPGDSGHRMVYGPKGTDVSLTETSRPDLSNQDFIKILLDLFVNPDQAAQKAKEIIDDLSKPVPVALFRVKIAKRHLVEGEEPKSRVVALPLESKYEPWSQTLYDYFKAAKCNYVFPFTRQEVWRWITVEEPIFKGLTYPVETYSFKPKGERIEVKKVKLKTVIGHPHIAKIHFIRHIRVNELMENYEFDGFDYAAYVGWSLSRQQNVNAPQAPPMLRTYATQIYESGWKRYIKKLLKPQVKT